jgi:membrane-bound acyltransferase YfiQ involved in biofilm formation
MHRQSISAGEILLNTYALVKGFVSVENRNNVNTYVQYITFFFVCTIVLGLRMAKRKNKIKKKKSIQLTKRMG